MPKMTRMQMKEAAREWAVIGLKIQKLQDAKTRDLDAFAEAHKDDLAAIDAKHDGKIAELTLKQLVLEKQVLTWLGEYKKPVTIDAELAIAANVEKVGNRVLDPQKFFDFVKDRSEKFWACVTIAVGKADELIGKQKASELSDKPTKIEPSLKLK